MAPIHNCKWAGYILLVVVCVAVKGQKERGYGLCWTKWINKNVASEGVDNEVLSSSEAFVSGVCPKPLAVDVARIDGLPVKEKLNCEFFGCVCRDINQRPGVKCGDYKVRFLCLCQDIYKNKDEIPRSALMCHNSTKQTFQCPNTTVISVQSAYYGTIWLSSCGFGLLNSVCRQESSKVLKMIKKVCDGKKTCTVQGPPHNYGGPSCALVNKHLHIEINCAEKCVHKGKVYHTGNEYVDPSCKVKCTCVKGGRFVCIPLCPVTYGIVCPNKGVVRLRRRPVSRSPKCSCLIPTCFNSVSKGCSVGEHVYKPGQTFHRNCKEECQCIGQGRLSCRPLCIKMPVKCAKNQVLQDEDEKTKYPGCTCQIATCIAQR